jgi:thiol-disulfide isomerase/thioredoxin
MKLQGILAVSVLLMSGSLQAQQFLQKGIWKAYLQREDGQKIVFNLDVREQNKQPVWYVLNAGERLEVKEVQRKGDSLLVNMPFFESAFRARIIAADSIQGQWVKGTPGKDVIVPFYASARQTTRFLPVKGKPLYNVSGKWSVHFQSRRANDEAAPAIAVLQQKGQQVSGSVLTPSGDYRYLEGLVTGDSLVMSTFDGSHAFLFTARLDGERRLNQGMFYSGAAAKTGWSAVRNDTATLPDLSAMYLKPGEDGYPDFRFKDLDGREVSLHDDRFKNKVVILQLMGSWCPNCMDETAFLSEWYKKNHQRGVEIIALAYEYSTDFERSRRDLLKFQQRFKVDYPVLITGVTVMDSLRTEKTLPQFTPIKTFPTSIVLDKKGKVRKIDTGFFGPGTGVYYERYKEEFERTVDDLLKEQ